jgi:4-carboxymuconolactone decarboxylase
MSNAPIAPRNPFADIAPALADYTDRVLFGDVWKRAGLSPRDRSLITVASLISLYRINEIPFHLKRALENGVTRGELRNGSILLKNSVCGSSQKFKRL